MSGMGLPDLRDTGRDDFQSETLVSDSVKTGHQLEKNMLYNVMGQEDNTQPRIIPQEEYCEPQAADRDTKLREADYREVFVC